MGQVHFRGAIWTNHALSRLSERGFTQDVAASAFNNPDNSAPGKETGTTLYTKRYGKSLVTVVARRNEKGEWVIISCWVNPPLPGSVDAKKRDANRAYHKSSGWGKIWLIIKQQLGISKY